MTISGVFSESVTLVVTLAASPNGATEAQTTAAPQLPPAPDPNSLDTTQISPEADALSKLPQAAASKADDAFAKLDADGDGSVTAQEFADNAGQVLGDLRAARHAHGHHGHHGRRLDRLFSRIDTNGDGTLSKDELSAAVAAASERHGHGRHPVDAASASAATPAADSTAAPGGTGDVAQPAGTVETLTFSFSFTAIVQYRAVSGTPADTAVGTQIDAAA